MRVFSTDHHLLHKPSFELKKGVPGPPYDDGSRVARIRDALKTLGCAWEAPADFGEAPIRAVHDDDYVDFLKTIWGDWEAEGESNDLLPLMWPVEGLRTDVAPQTVDGRMIKYAFDSGTAITAGTWAASYAAAQCAIAAAEAAQRDGLAYALTRPPGHHAMRGHYGGYCFLNGAAIAAHHLSDHGLDTSSLALPETRRIAVLDIDYHHGNGTQDIFWRRDDVFVGNLHADPRTEYPYLLGYADEVGEGDGRGTTRNIPLPAGTDGDLFMTALVSMLDTIGAFGPDVLVLSFGGDTSEDDPLGRFNLKISDYQEIGEAIAKRGWPVAVIQEGGYALDCIGDVVSQLFKGLGLR